MVSSIAVRWSTSHPSRTSRGTSRSCSHESSAPSTTSVRHRSVSSCSADGSAIPSASRISSTDRCRTSSIAASVSDVAITEPVRSKATYPGR
ncbi:hypothetical protein I6J71_01675 [Amycolatopsis sp. FDAARGOS 1241]|nr:hypothetical protein I6J71_01675 [Amycolatopsis sp. FDAARGOS 1241]